MTNADEPSAPRPAQTPAIFKAPKQVSRPKAIIAQDEEIGTELRLGEFQNVVALSVSEARAVITAVHGARRKRDPASNPLGGDKIHNDSEPIIKFLEYMEMFSRFKQTENLHALSNLIDSHPEFAPVERAQLGSLCCETADEAKTLIPSIANKIHDDELQELLDEMQKLRQFVD
ncbi:hypothetical protein K432DRAFT_152858 [Lepidopterella palustris CBS 459.81]|uniref:RNA polymerase Rpb4/RPC9 core domain-containing protein n=1 Tax=Lepidopterella palustris CBS 459.81 TaxID=1314670 RepID=A0A8E2E2I9_9PEZI|nr:hypothetical protein K432DRAFT_152858 [Lepidopterella palustris CBS 459.81]